MKKRRPVKHHKENIFLFPDVERLLMEKGLECLKQKKFRDAIEYLEKAQELDVDNEDISIGLILAYFESGDYLAAKILANDILQKGLGDYFQLIDIYLMVLLQLNEHEEIVTTLEALIDEKEVPADKIANLTKILEFSKRTLETDSFIVEEYEEKEDNWDLSATKNINEQFLQVARLAEKNVRGYLKDISFYLISTDGHPFIKTMLLQLLKEQEVNVELEIEKFGRMLKVTPYTLKNLEEQVFWENMKESLKGSLLHVDPILFETIKSMIERHAFLLYPFEFYSDKPEAWSTAYHILGLEYYGNEVSLVKIAQKYSAESDLVIEIFGFIKELEEISSPIL